MRGIFGDGITHTDAFKGHLSRENADLNVYTVFCQRNNICKRFCALPFNSDPKIAAVHSGQIYCRLTAVGVDPAATDITCCDIELITISAVSAELDHLSLHFNVACA